MIGAYAQETQQASHHEDHDGDRLLPQQPDNTVGQGVCGAGGLQHSGQQAADDDKQKNGTHEINRLGHKRVEYRVQWPSLTGAANDHRGDQRCQDRGQAFISENDKYCDT